MMQAREPKTEKEFQEYYDLRWRILRKPWKQPRGSEKDELEKESIHIMVYEKGKPLGVGRLHFNSPQKETEGGRRHLQARIEAQIRYMAVEYGFQGKGVGTVILKELEIKAREKGASRIVLNARESAVGFYKKHGYSITGKAHTLFGVIPHYKMRKELKDG